MSRFRIGHALGVAAVSAALLVPAATASAPAVGPLPKGTTKTISVKPGATFTATLPKPRVAGRVWRIARAFNGAVVTETHESDSGANLVVRFKARKAGSTKIVFAMTLGERSHAYAAVTYAVRVHS